MYFSQSRIYLSSPCIDQYTFQTPFQRLTLRMTRFYTSQPSVKVWNRLQQIMRKMGYDARTSADKVFTGMGPYTCLIHWPHTLASYTGLIHTLASYTGLIYWPHTGLTLASYTGLTHWPHTHTGLIYWPHTLASHTGLIHWPHTLTSYTGLIHWPHTLASYTGLIHWPHTLASHTGLIH